MERRWLSGRGEGGCFLSFLPRPSNPPLIHAAEPAALHFSSPDGHALQIENRSLLEITFNCSFCPSFFRLGSCMKNFREGSRMSA